MSGIKGSVGDVGQIMAKLGEIQNVVFLAAADQIAEGAVMIHRHAVISVQSHESASKTVQLYKPNRVHDVSAPGNPPNSDLGTLAQSIAFEIDKDNLSAVIGTNLEYGKFLELGTSKMAARPWLFPAFEAHNDQVHTNIAEAVRDAIQGAS